MRCKLELPLGLLGSMLLVISLLSPSVIQAQSKDRMKDIIKEAEELANDLDDDFDDAMDDTPLDGTDEEERLDRQAEALEDTLDEIRDKFDDDDYMKLRGLVERALAIANDIDRVIFRYRFTADVERDWQQLRDHLNSLARYYNLQSLPGRRF